jgi:hypothetical protein
MKKQATEMPTEKAADAFSWLEPGRVYRTRDLVTFRPNAPCLTRHLVEPGRVGPPGSRRSLFEHAKQARDLDPGRGAGKAR